MSEVVLKPHWQHTVPQRTEHVAHPNVAFIKPTVGRTARCTVCGKSVTYFPADEGPESLKALLRF